MATVFSIKQYEDKKLSVGHFEGLEDYQLREESKTFFGNLTKLYFIDKKVSDKTVSLEIGVCRGIVYGFISYVNLHEAENIVKSLSLIFEFEYIERE